MDLQKIQCSNKCGRWIESTASLCPVCIYISGLGQGYLQDDNEFKNSPGFDESKRNLPSKTLSETDVNTKGDGWKFNLFNRRSESRNDNKSTIMSGFMKLFVSNSQREIQEMFYKFIEAIGASKSDDPLKYSRLYHDYYTQLKNHLFTINKYRTIVEQDINILGSCIERILFVKIKQKLIDLIRANNDDLRFSFKIYHLSWVTEDHLHIPKNVHFTPAASLLFCQAQDSLVEMMRRNSPSGKLISLSKCCRKIFALINEFNLKRPASADDFFPLFVYTIIKTSPQDIKSNINFLNLFAQKSNLDAGECAYYFTSLVCAIEFIENANNQSFNLTQEEYIQNVENSKTDIEKTMEKINIRLETLRLQREDLRKKVTSFQQTIFQEQFQHTVGMLDY